MAMFKEPVFKQMGSCLKLLMVAEGEAHIYPRCVFQNKCTALL